MHRSKTASPASRFCRDNRRGGGEGLKRAKERHPLAITLDILMPDIDGWTVLAALRGDPQLADIPVVIATIVEERRKGMALGTVGYLTKPIGCFVTGIPAPTTHVSIRAVFTRSDHSRWGQNTCSPSIL
jgi:PleD family two-component response regulator